MCGRYASPRTRSELLETFKIEQALADEEKPPDYNVAPTKTPAVVLARPPRDDKDAEPVRQLRFSALVSLVMVEGARTPDYRWTKVLDWEQSGLERRSVVNDDPNEEQVGH